MKVAAMRRIDLVATAAQPIGTVGIAGVWRSSDQQTRGIDQIQITNCGDKPAKARIVGADGDRLIDWGFVPVASLFAEGITSSSCAGFQLHYKLPFFESHIQANLKLGVLVLGVHQSFLGKHGDYFFREFLALTEREKESPIEPFSERSCHFDEILGNSQPELDLLVGSWSNTNPDSGGITSIEFEPAGSGFRVRLQSAGANGPIDWGWTEGPIFSCVEEDLVPSAAALARYDFGFFDCELQFRQNKGILAVTTFNRFHDCSGRNDYVSRELFHRTS